MKVWVDNEYLDDGDLNYIGDRLVHRYSTVSDRNAGIGTPTNGQLAYVYSLRSLTMFNEGVWVTLAPIPPGGTTGQVLAKASNSNYDLHWVTPS